MDAAPAVLDLPFAGRWLVQNSPADRVPSHGTHLFGTAYAIDFVPVDATGRSASITLGTWFVPEPPDRFVGFGTPILAPVAGRVVAVHDGEPDHTARRGLPSIGYALTQGARARSMAGLAGNHVVIEATCGFVTLCHLQRGSLAVAPGRVVGPGDPVGACGNSGNSTEPHLHLQVTNSTDWGRARGVPIAFRRGGGTFLPRNGEVVEA